MAAAVPAGIVMRTFKLTLAYDGAEFAGWQFQPDRRTIQGTLQAALEKITGAATSVVGSGRTDAGVHALGQVVSFQSPTHLSADILFKALNAELPDDMSVVTVEEAAPGFHAIRDAVRKRYRYVLVDGPAPDVFRRRYAWRPWRGLNVEAMSRAAASLIGTHDFRSFETDFPQRASSVRTVFDLNVVRPLPAEPHVIHVEIEADGFLYNMVRTIVGTLVDVGRGRRGEAWPGEALAALDRRAAGMTAPPQGLFLLWVRYA